MKIVEVISKITQIEYLGEKYINLQELFDLLKGEQKLEMTECIIMPYYIQDKMRFELYEYEFYCTNEKSFEQYILSITGKSNLEEISNEILSLREKCFANIDEPQKIVDYLDFVLQSKKLQEEILKIFGKYTSKNLYALVY